MSTDFVPDKTHARKCVSVDISYTPRREYARIVRNGLTQRVLFCFSCKYCSIWGLHHAIFLLGIMKLGQAWESGSVEF
eukprot:525356-Amorphochlora_amoeboformis.AAC.1